MARLERAPHGVDRNGLAIAIIRIDRLDLINGRLGRAIGDEVVRACAMRLEASSGGAVCGRVSGSTFALIRPTTDAADAWVARVTRALAEPMIIGGIGLHLSSATTLVTPDGFHHDAETLLSDAELEARRARRRARGAVHHVHLAIGLDAPDPLGVASHVDRAVSAGTISADYQPVFDLATMEPVGAEALARWRTPVPGLEGPADFLEIVRALGRGAEVLDRILRQVCAEFASGPAAERGWWVSVNLGIDDCADQTLPARIQAILEATGMDPGRLVLEISERAIPDPAVERALRNLTRLGVGLAIDDFGSGWSSLAQLRSLPISMIKIDRSLVASPSTVDAHLTLATIALADALGLQTLAEGVEASKDLRLLYLAGCRLGQGFWWSGAAPLHLILERFPATVPGDEGPASAPDSGGDGEHRADGRDGAHGAEVAALLESSLRELAIDLTDDRTGDGPA